MPDPAAANPPAPPPTSLTGYVVAPERLSMILPHVRTLSETALSVSDELPLDADGGDFAATLELRGE